MTSHARVMVVEDEAIIGKDIEEQLSQLGYEVTSLVFSGRQAISKALIDRPDLIIIDIALGEGPDGIEVAEEIRAQQDIPVIFLTAFDHDEVFSRAKSSGPMAYIFKPLDLREIRVAIELALHRANMEKRLKENEERFRLVADFTYDWETWTDQDGRLAYVSPSCLLITGRRREEFLDDPHIIMDIAHPEDRPALEAHFAKYEVTKEVLHLDFRIITPAGEERWISHYCQPVYGRDWSYLGRRASNRDVTEHIRTVNELEKALAEVKTLRGLIPICSSCKKIRDSQGSWQRLEKYIQEHTEASFSHGICPDCAKRLYPEFFSKSEST